MIGKQFGRLTVIQEDKESVRKKLHCSCTCGKSVSVRKDALESKSEPTQSCGCLQKEIISKRCRKHYLCNHYLYKIWKSIRQRCYNSNNANFHNYGGRGIKLHKSWHNFQNFYIYVVETIGFKPTIKHSIDRIDNNKGYRPGNLRWSIQKEQMFNIRTNMLVTYKSKKYRAQVLAKEFDINYDAFRSRIRMGWPIEKILTTPVKYRTPKTPKKLDVLSLVSKSHPSCRTTLSVRQQDHESS